MGTEKPRNGGLWTESRYISFVKSALRGARWPVKYECIKNAKVGYGLYRCAICGTVGPPTLPAEEGKKNRRKNAVADHIDPVVDPEDGFTTWDEFIDRLYVEKDGLQCLCFSCHSKKSAEENIVRRVVKSNRKLFPREEGTYRNMMSRCYNPKATGYQYYGGKGVRVCDEWNGSFERFYKDMGDRPEGYSLDRIDYDGDYCKENCRWATYSEQARNTSNNHYIAFNGISKSLIEWSEELGILQNTILYRIRRGWSAGEALGFVEREKPHLSRLSKDTWAEVQSLRDSGYTTVELGKMFDIDTSQISRKTKNNSQLQEEEDNGS